MNLRIEKNIQRVGEIHPPLCLLRAADPHRIGAIIAIWGNGLGAVDSCRDGRSTGHIYSLRCR